MSQGTHRAMFFLGINIAVCHNYTWKEQFTYIQTSLGSIKGLVQSSAVATCLLLSRFKTADISFNILLPIFQARISNFSAQFKISQLLEIEKDDTL